MRPWITSPNTFGWGAKVRVLARIGGESRWLTRWNIPTTGYGSQNDLMIHIGLDHAESVDSVVVRWPSGHEDHLGPLEARRAWELQEGGEADSSVAGSAGSRAP